MKTKIVRIEEENIDRQAIREAGEILKAGGLVAPEIPLRFGAHIFQGVYVPKEYYDENEALLRRDTGFRPQVSFEEGIGRLAAWMKETEASEV